MVERADEVAAAVARDRFAHEHVVDRESAARIEPARPDRPAAAVEQGVRVAVRYAQALRAIEGDAVLGRSRGSSLQLDGLPRGRRILGLRRCATREDDQIGKGARLIGPSLLLFAGFANVVAKPQPRGLCWSEIDLALLKAFSPRRIGAEPEGPRSNVTGYTSRTGEKAK